MKTYSIYYLREPDTGEIRYFGQTCQDIQKRFIAHSRVKPTQYVSRWVQSLRREGKLPILDVLMSGLEKWEADEEEKSLIAWGRKKGLRLTNLTDGGDGTSGFFHSQQTKEKISNAHKGENNANFGKPVSPEVKQKIRNSLRGRTIAWAGKVSKSLQGKRKNPVSGYLGVTWHRTKKNWQVRIGFEGINYYLGSFHDSIEAAKAYDAAAIKFYGDIARLNFPVSTQEGVEKST